VLEGFEFGFAVEPVVAIAIGVGGVSAYHAVF